MNVGVIGLGAMGFVMARNLCKAGHTVTVFNRTRSKAEALVADGACVADTPAAAAKGDVVISLLSDDAAVEELVLGSGGLLNGLAAHTVHVCMSTISAALAERLTEAHAAAQRAYVSAPVFGRPDAAAAAKLFIVAGGAAAAIARCQPVFDALGQQTFVMGEKPVMANITKISGNFLIASAIESMSEAFALVRKYGLEPQAFLDLLTSTIFAAPVYKNYGGIIAQERFDPPGFKLPLGLKDVRLALAAGDATHTPLPIASVVRDHLVAAMAKGYEDLDWAVLGRIAAQNAGLE